jgi:hypothetical protein
MRSFELGEQARHRAPENFGVEATLSAHARLYDEVAANARRERR